MINNTHKGTGFFPSAQIAGMMPGDANIEFLGVRITKEVVWLQNGCTHYFSDLPLQYYSLLKKAYLKDHKAQNFLKKVADEFSRQVELYTYYMYGEIDSTPDICNGKLGPSENFRDTTNCPSLLWCSKTITIGCHELTPRQLVIIDLIGKDLPNKTIASFIGISLSTYDFHITKLFRAVGVTNKTALLKLALTSKILL